MSAKEKSLYDRLGGYDAICAVEPGVQQQQSGGGTGQRPAHHGNGRLAAGG